MTAGAAAGAAGATGAAWTAGEALFPKRRERAAIDHGLVFHHRFDEVASVPALWPATIATANAAALPSFVFIRLLANLLVG
jgi:hypothetical protein